MMALYIALKIIDETFTYNGIFKFRLYQRYREEVEAILEAEGKADLIGK
jgi:hypothetical protein